MAFRRLVRLAAAAAAACTVGCGDSPVDPSGPSPIFYRATAAASPVNNLSAIVTVEAARYDSAALSYWRDNEPPRRTPAYPFDGDSTVRIPVLGLGASSNYSIETVLFVKSAGEAVDTAEFISGPMPAWIPTIGAQGVDTTPGLVALSLPDGPVIVDNLGQVLWYAYMPGGALNSFQAHRNGRYTLLATSGFTPYKVLNILGEEVGSIECQGYRTRFHDVMVRAGGDYWIMCDDDRTLDLTSTGGQPQALVTGTVIQHISAAGQLLFQWNAFDHFQITDLPAEDRNGVNVNFTHGNALNLDVDGNLIASFRSLSEITKINITSGEIMWRFGGLANEFAVSNDPKGAFQRQHGVRLAGPGQIQLLDNRLIAPSRMVRYLLNPVAKTALLVMSFEDAPATFTMVGGSTEYYPNGHALVSFGRAGRVVETDAAGNRAWELTGLEGIYVFRAERIIDLYHPIPVGTR